jgi:hypothetical protein
MVAVFAVSNCFAPQMIALDYAKAPLNSYPIRATKASSLVTGPSYLSNAFTLSVPAPPISTITSNYALMWFCKALSACLSP